MRKSLSTVLLVSLGLAMMPACSAGPDGGGENVAAATEGLTKCSGGSIFQGDYCDDPACPCDDGEGDCENDTQCTASPGLVCGTDNGNHFGAYWQTNVCWPATCQNGMLDPGEITIDNGGPCGCEQVDFYADHDNDGWGKIMTPNRSCAPYPDPGNWVTKTGDCNEFNPNINPGAAEICGDTLDSNCDGQLNDGCSAATWCLDNDQDSYPRSTGCVTQVAQPAYNWISVDGNTEYDCNDTYPTINPGAAEICGDTIDSNCDGQLNDGCAATDWCLDNDSDGFPRSTGCVSSVTKPANKWLPVSGSTEYDCNDQVAAINPNATEVCNRKDDNCNGQIDENAVKVWYLDNDGDGFPRTGGYSSCFQPAYNWIEWSGPFDCNDQFASINPNAPEVCGDNIDNNCDGIQDQDCQPLTCTNGVQDANETGVDCGGFCKVCSNGPTPTSCVGLAKTCGASGGQDCCAATTVFGADFYRTYDGTPEYPSQAYPATVNSYRLDTYEVTVGRFRKFVQTFDTYRGAGNPTAGAGTHPLIANSGWDATWPLAASAAELTTNLNCGDPAYRTWTDTVGANETLPVGCVNWYESAAFCAWDGGRLPTDAEWNLAAAGGAQQRVFPWSSPPSSTTLSLTNAAYACWLDGDYNSCTINDVATVGQFPAGLGRYLQADLAGNVWEWNLDWYESAQVNPCVNCANLSPAVQQFRVVRGGSFQSLGGTNTNLRSSRRSITAPSLRDPNVGLRCARGN